MYRDLGLHPRARRDEGYAYLIYPHKPVVAYMPETGRLLNEYCVEFPDMSDAITGSRLPDSDDVLAKWMALTGDERAPDPHGEHAPAGPAGRPGPRTPRPVATRAMGAGALQRPFVSDRRSADDPRGPRRGPPRARTSTASATRDEDLARPIIGVANTWTEAMPCNFHLRRLAEKVKEGIRAAGGTPMEFNTIAVSDGITMGTEGMRASLVSREVIADSIELMARGYMFDGVIALSGCDKTIPGCVMALARLDVPSLMLYGGSIMPGHWRGKDVTIQEVFEAVGAHAAGDMSDEDLSDLEHHASPGAGACGGQFTANTMATAFEMLGISAMGSGMVPAEDGKKGKVAEECGRLVVELVEEGPDAEQDHHQGVARERDRLRGDDRRLDERGAAPARGRERRGRRPDDRRLRPHQLARRRCWPTSSRSGASSRPTCSGRAACASSRTG